MEKFNLFVNKYNNTLKFEQDAQLKQYWQNFIAPSCVNKVVLFDGMDTFYECAICQKRLLYQSVIIRHYREQHAAQMPKDIFGATDLFECKVCDVKFKRDSHYKTHIASTSHLQTEESIFQVSFNKRLNKRDRVDSDECFLPDKKARISTQQDAYRKSPDTPVCSDQNDTFLNIQKALDCIQNDEYTGTQEQLTNIQSGNVQMHVDPANENIFADDDDLLQRFFLIEQFVIEEARTIFNQNKLVKSLSSDLVNKLSF